MDEPRKYGPSRLERVLPIVVAEETEQAWRRSIFRQLGVTPPVRWPVLLSPAEFREWLQSTMGNRNDDPVG